MRLPDHIESYPVVKNKKLQQIWKEDILINYKNSNDALHYMLNNKNHFSLCHFSRKNLLYILIQSSNNR